MTGEQITASLAAHILHWRTCPDRFLTGNRGWKPRGQFRPTIHIQDAFKLLLAAKPSEYTMGGGQGKRCWAKVRIGSVFGEASAESIPVAICLAIARAVGIEVEECE